MNHARHDTMCTAPRSILDPSSLSRRRGFSFTEVMFAVIILGIGFIMVAAIFPVAIQQTRLTVDESTAAGVARHASSVLEQMMVGSEKGSPSGGPLFPAAGANIVAPDRTHPSLALLWDRLRGSLISPADPRYAWTMLYRRSAGSQFVQVYIFVLQQRNRTTFDARDLAVQGALPANLQPRRVTARTFPAAAGGADPDTISVTSPNPNFSYDAEGAFIVLADGPGAGQVFRLGVARGLAPTGGQLYEIDPGYDVTTAYAANAWVVGRGIEAGNPTGPAMDVAFYTTFLTVN